MIDYIITQRNDIGDASNVRVLRSAECGTDHFMVRGKSKFCIRKKIGITGVQVPRHINVAKVDHPGTRKSLSEAFDSLHFDGLWANFKEQVHSVGVDILGLGHKKHRDWFDENDHENNQLLFRKHELYELLLNENLSEHSPCC